MPFPIDIFYDVSFQSISKQICHVVFYDRSFPQSFNGVFYGQPNLQYSNSTISWQAFITQIMTKIHWKIERISVSQSIRPVQCRFHICETIWLIFLSFHYEWNQLFPSDEKRVDFVYRYFLSTPFVEISDLDISARGVKKDHRNNNKGGCLIKTSHPRIAHGQRYPMPCLEW